jgi:tetratricopeptide (TPR) repeat protein
MAAAFFMYAAYYAKLVADPVVIDEGVGIAGQLARAGYAVTWYVARTAWPTGLSTMHEWHAAGTDMDPWLLAGVLACLSLSGVVAWSGRRRPGGLAAWCAYLALIAPTSNLLRSVVGLVADRYAYVATIPLFVALSYTLARLFAMPRPGIRRATAAAVVGAAMGLGGLSWRQCLTWRDTDALIAHAAEAGTISQGRHLVYLGQIRERQRRFEQAESCFREAVRRAPDSAEAAANLGVYLVRRRKPREGLPWLERAVALDPRHFEAYNDLGVALARQGRLDEAARQFETALRIHPYYIDARYNLARVLHDRGRFAEAAEQYALVLRGDPGHARALAGLAELSRSAP